MKSRLKAIMKQCLLLILILTICTDLLTGQSAMINIQTRDKRSLNGEWKVILDPTGIGDWRQVWLEKKPQKKTDFFEYSFEGGPSLKVPGDINTQMCELTYFEGTVWYKKEFVQSIVSDKRIFIYFGALNYLTDIYLNGKKTGSHEGGFTPFQLEITDKVLIGKNTLIVKVNNQRLKNGLPGLGYDWFNYGGITRDVYIVKTNSTYIEDYFIQLKNHSTNEVLGWIKLNGIQQMQPIKVKIPELDLDYSTVSDSSGIASVRFSSPFKLWSPENPKLYKVVIECQTDTIEDEIGFRNIEVRGNKVFLNNNPIFLKGVNVHEENPIKAAKAFSEEDAILLLNWAKELECNLVRLAHYPHNENMVRLAEKMGLMVWSELPVYQHIEFADTVIPQKMDLMMNEMMRRDRNRCGVVIWSLSNETYSFTPNRDKALIELTQKCRAKDSTRLITHVINNQGYENSTFNVWDTIYTYTDIISLNEYIGWYVPWQGKPADTKWKLICNNKPVFISEFGGEALYGSNYGPKDEATYWSEDYQEQIYKDQIEMFKTVPNLCGVCPWLLVDYRSLGRMHPIYQNGWNRKGLISEKGKKKKAWYIMKKYYENLKND
jgi:beta-glucuronidase